LIEADMTFDLAKADLKTHKFDDGEVLTENIAILGVIADKHPALMAAASTMCAIFDRRHSSLGK